MAPHDHRIRKVDQPHPDPVLLALVELASGAETEAAQREIVEQEIAHQHVLGGFDGDDLIAFASFIEHDDDLVIEYIAVAPEHQGRGWGGALVDAVAAAAGGRPVIAETDDDAVEFYRARGFAIAPGAPDPRYPGVTRYHCVRE